MLPANALHFYCAWATGSDQSQTATSHARFFCETIMSKNFPDLTLQIRRVHDLVKEFHSRDRSHVCVDANARMFPKFLPN
jgi:chemotaxis regulatin CheY-phosphate phosphatase CheZ